MLKILRNCSRLKYSQESLIIMENQCFFKGMNIEKTATMLHFRWNEIFLNIDFYGLDTKKTLSFDRKGIKKEAMNEVRKIINSAIDFYLAEIEEILLMEKGNRNDRENEWIYTYWCLASLKKKIILKLSINISFSETPRYPHNPR